MNILNIFIASSCELSDDRIFIGDCIRRLNDEYEVQGLQIQLLCWEDYCPEYTGERKQTEYNRDLVLKSQLVIGLFKTKCGKYTQEEIELAQEQLGKENVFCYQRNVEKKEECNPEIGRFLSDRKLTSFLYCDYDDLEKLLRKQITEYIERKNIQLTGSVQLNGTKLYATISDLDYSIKIQLSNIVRYIDKICSEKLSLRCFLHPYHQLDSLSSTDYYIALLNENLTETDDYEICQAGLSTRDGIVEKMALYYEPEYKWYETSLGEQIKSWKYFPISYGGLDTVKFNILCYLLYDKCTSFVQADRFFTVQNGVLHWDTYPIVDINSIPEFSSGKIFVEQIRVLNQRIEEHRQLLPDGVEVDEEIQRLTSDKEIKEKALTSLCCQIIDIFKDQSRIEVEKNRDLRRKYKEGKYLDVAKAVNPQTLLHNVEDIESKKKAIDVFDEELKKQLLAEVEKCELKIKSLLSMKSTPTCAKNLIEISKARVDILKKGKEFQWTSFNELLRAMSFYASLVENLEWKSVDKVELYGEIVRLADKEKEVDLQVEMARANLGNELSLIGKHKEAFSNWKKTIDNLRKMDDGSIFIRKMCSQVYIGYLTFYLNIEVYNDTVDFLFKEWKSYIETWDKNHISYLQEKGNVYSLALRALNRGKSDSYAKGCTIIDEACRIYKKLASKTIDYQEDELKNLIYLGNNIGAYFIDFSRYNMSYLCLTEQYLLSANQLCNQLYRMNSQESVYWYSRNFHNLGFIESKVGHLEKAYDYYEKSLYYCQFMDNSWMKYNKKAETLVNMGSCLLEMKRYDEAISPANESIQIYQSFVNSGFNEEFDQMNLYKAKQLLGTIYYEIPSKKSLGLSLLKECWQWASNHSECSYIKTFKDYSFRILKENRLV